MKKGEFRRNLTKRFGKILDTDTMWLDKLQFATELRLLKKKDSWSGVPAFTYTLLHIAEEGNENNRLGTVIYAQGEDPKELHKELKKELQKLYEVEWTDMICVCVKKPSVSNDRDTKKASIGIEVQRYQAGVRKIDGSKCWRGMRYSEGWKDRPAGWHPDSRVYEAESPIKDRCYYERENEYGVIEYTDENWEKLMAINEVIEALRMKAVHVLTGDGLLHQLAMLSVSGFMLPPAEEEKQEDGFE